MFLEYCIHHLAESTSNWCFLTFVLLKTLIMPLLLIKKSSLLIKIIHIVMIVMVKIYYFMIKIKLVVLITRVLLLVEELLYIDILHHYP